MTSQELFFTTRWSVVLQAADIAAPQAHAALSDLCAAYWFPLYAYIRRRGHSQHDAEDLTQGFFARLLRLNSLGSVRQDSGKFRAYLLAALKHYLADQHDRATAARRNSAVTVPFDPAQAEQRYLTEAASPIHALSPEQLYERQWALALLEQVLHTLQAEYEASGRGDWFRALRFAITGERSAVPYQELAQTLGTTGEAVKVAVHRLRKRYRQTLRDTIAGTVGSEAAVEDELLALRRMLSAPPSQRR